MVSIPSATIGPFVFGNRPVRTRMPGGVVAGGAPPATRLGGVLPLFIR